MTYTHAYDLEGRQSSVSVGGVTTTFIRNGDGELVAKQVAGATVAHYALGGPSEKDPQSGATTKYYRLGAALVALRDSALHSLGHDHLGTSTLQTSAAGAFRGR